MQHLEYSQIHQSVYSTKAAPVEAKGAPGPPVQQDLCAQVQQRAAAVHQGIHDRLGSQGLGVVQKDKQHAAAGHPQAPGAMPGFRV